MKMGKKIIYILIGVIATLLVLGIMSPYILKSLGFHPDYEGEEFDLKGKKALIVTTSHGVLNKPGETDGPATGVFASEMTIPYYEFFDANMDVDLASIKGGEIPIDPFSFRRALQSDQDKRYLEDEAFQAKTRNSIRIDEIDIKEYDVVFFAGGWGAAYDMASETMGKRVSDAYYNSDILFGSVCHGALAFTEARDSTGEYLVKGRTMTGVTQKQLQQFGIEFTPKHPEEELTKAGANYQANHKRVDPFATLTVMDEEKRFITGQNQNSSHETAQLIMKVLNEK
ncbi:MAG: type 1 glutamine amidotransferase domain-containing protein [Bacteroidia bacterium]|nr:type 1 glutamine amidotransferase domain-containing protein [Bacteroidia bacterium]